PASRPRAPRRLELPLVRGPAPALRARRSAPGTRAACPPSGRPQDRPHECRCRSDRGPRLSDPVVVRVAALPFELRWLSPPVSFELGRDWLRVEAGPRTDWFVDPAGESEPVTTGPALVGRAAGDYLLAARVTVDFAATFDAGVLMLHADE